MGVLQDAVQWVQNIYQLETTDKVLGGLLPTGISNRQAQELANRTAFLLDLCEKLQDQLDTVHPIGEVQYLAAPAYNAADYDTTGLGKPNTPAQHWALCNGQNGTADMRGRFPVGMDTASLDYPSPGAAGGVEKVALTVAQLPSLNLNGGNPNAVYAYKDGHITLNSATDDSSSEPNLSRTAPIPQIGGNESHENRPPYYTLVFRQRVSN